MWHASSLLALFLQAVTLVVAALLLRVAWKGYRLSGARPLRAFLVGIGLFVASQAALIALELAARAMQEIKPYGVDHFDVLFWTHYTLLVGSALAILATFDRRKFRWYLAMGPLLLVAGPIAQILVIALQFLIVVHAGLNHIERARAGSMQTAIGFFLVFAGHFASIFGYEPLSPRSVVGECLVLAGTLLLYLAAARPRGAST